MITKRPRGTQDWYGEDMYMRTVIEERARAICKVYNIKEVITPVFEHTILFQRSVGETTDVVQKEMYTFDDKGDRSITLKPEGTAGVVRAFLENSLYAEVQPTKLFYITPAFRYENPQSGRLRQHHQFGIEIFGAANPLGEVELISLVTEFMDRIGIKNSKLCINSIGCKSCRQDFNTALLKYLNNHKDELCVTCKERMEKNPLRVIDCKVSSCGEIVKDAPTTIEYLDEECKEHFEELQELLNGLAIEFEINTKIVRGLDYYTRTVFEFLNEDGFTLCGGGRYDNLIKEIDGKKEVPAVGFGFGIERMINEIRSQGSTLPKEPAVELYIGILGKEAKVESYKIVNELRKSGIIVETDYLDRSVRAQMKYANKISARKTVIIGMNEIEENKAKIRDMENGEEIEVELSKIVEFML